MIPLPTIPPETLYASASVFVWLSVIQYARRWGYGLAFLSIAGTVIHELMHYISGFFLNAKPVSVSLWPKRRGNSWVLGSVGFTNLNIWNSAFVAFAPLAMFPLAWFLFQEWLLPAFRDAHYLTWGLSGYIVACCLFAGFPSSTDVKVGFLSATMYLSVGAGIIFGYPKIPF